MVELYEYWGVKRPEVQEFLARRYVERLIGCIENVTNPSCDLDKKEKKEHIAKIVNSKTTRECLKIAQPRSTYMKIMLLPLKWRWVGLCMLEGSYISKVKKRNVKRFVKLKANR